MRAISRTLGILTFLVATDALADNVVVLPFRATEGAADKKDLVTLKGAASGATTDRGHTLVPAAAATRAEKSSKDGVFDTQAELIAAGKTADANWTLSAKVEARAAGVYAIDLEACQVGTGRVELVARDVEVANARVQIAEMLALLLRPEGINGAELPWKKNVPPQPLPKPEPTPEPPKPTPPVPAPVPQPPPAEVHVFTPPPRGYGEDHPFVAGLGVGFISAFKRPTGAVGNATSLLVQASFGYAVLTTSDNKDNPDRSTSALELRFDAAAGAIGPGSFLLDGGARYALFLNKNAQSGRFYIGPEAKIGAFIPFAGDKKARFLARGGGFVGMAITPELSLEIAPNVSVAAGGSGALAFFDTTLGVFYRF